MFDKLHSKYEVIYNMNHPNTIFLYNSNIMITVKYYL
jgi:hypothetical protein